jgi:hypothetical protein
MNYELYFLLIFNFFFNGGKNVYIFFDILQLTKGNVASHVEGKG